MDFYWIERVVARLLALEMWDRSKDTYPTAAAYEWLPDTKENI